MEAEVFAYWTMSNGAEFWLAIPKADQIRGDQFTSDVGFPFRFSEICCLEIPRSVRAGAFELRNDLEGIAAIFSKTDLPIIIKHDRIKIECAIN